MWKAALAGALACITVAAGPAASEPLYDRQTRGGYNSGVALSEGQIAQAKAALQLTPQQERHWPRVAAALRAMARQGARAQADEDGFVQRVRSRASELSAQAAGAKRVLSAAMPLIRTLNAEQKQTALSMVRSMGYGHLASRL